MQLYIFKH